VMVGLRSKHVVLRINCCVWIMCALIVTRVVDFSEIVCSLVSLKCK
jgi:hypothetical protein